MLIGSSGEKFDRSLYEVLSLEDREIIDEYIPKMMAGEVNSFMRRLVEHYKTEAMEEVLEVQEDRDSIEVFERNNISAKTDINAFVARFISSTHSSEDINDFFIDDNNFNFVLNNPQFYSDNKTTLLHIIKFFHLNKTLRVFLDDQKEIDGFIWDGVRAYFESKKIYKCGLYPYVGGFVSRQLRQKLDVGFICPFCSEYYTRNGNNKKSLISCVGCKNKFTFVGVKCPVDDCGKIAPLSSIDLQFFDKANIKHMRAISALTKYIDDVGMRYIADTLNITYNDIYNDGYDIPISSELKKKKIKNMPEYSLGNGLLSNVPEFLFYLPLVCPITSGHTRIKYVDGKKRDVFGGCGAKFMLRDGLRIAHSDGHDICHTYSPRRVKYIDAKKYNDNYEIYDGVVSLWAQEKKSNEINVDGNIPYDRIFGSINKYFDTKKTKNKAMLYLHKAIVKYFSIEYGKSISIIEGNIDATARAYVMDISNYLTDSGLQNNLYYNVPNNLYKIGWRPTTQAPACIREFYIELAKNDDSLVRKISNDKMKLCFYTYRISKIHGRKTTYRKRIGIAIDKNVLPKTSRASAGYGQNFKIDNKFISVYIEHAGQKIDLSKYVKGAAYWSPENAAIHGFDSRTGIIWFEGEEAVGDSWKFPNGIIVSNNSDAIVNITCTTDAFSKMFQRFDLNGKMREIVSGLESDGII